MPRAECVVRAFAAVAKAAYAARLAQVAECLASAPRKDFMGVALVRDIENDFVFRGVEDAVQGYGKLDYTEIGADVPALLRSDVDDFAPDFLGKLGQLLCGKLF